MNYRAIRRKFARRSQPILNLDKDFIYLLQTVDKFGHLMPSFLSTPISDRAIAAGLVEDCEVQGTKTKIWWQKLTEKGIEEKKKLQEAK